MDSPSMPPPSAAAPSSLKAQASAGASSARTQPTRVGNKIARDSDTQKYKVKYKDLKVKVREIERDNDKLALKILKAKRDIQRIRLERAIIFERLAIPLASEPHLPGAQSLALETANGSGEAAAVGQDRGGEGAMAGQ